MLDQRNAAIEELQDKLKSKELEFAQLGTKFIAIVAEEKTKRESVEVLQLTVDLLTKEIQDLTGKITVLEGEKTEWQRVVQHHLTEIGLYQVSFDLLVYSLHFKKTSL